MLLQIISNLLFSPKIHQIYQVKPKAKSLLWVALEHASDGHKSLKKLLPFDIQASRYRAATTLDSNSLPKFQGKKIVNETFRSKHLFFRNWILVRTFLFQCAPHHRTHGF
jgi:hypothetical protein